MVFWAGSVQAGTLTVTSPYNVSGSETYTFVEVNGGPLNIPTGATLNASGDFIINNNGNADSTVNVTGGTLNYTSKGGDGFQVGWWYGGYFNISAGVATLAHLEIYNGDVNLSGTGILDITTVDTLFSRDNLASNLTISGGTANLRGVKRQNSGGVQKLTLTGGTLNVGAGGLYGTTSDTLNFSGGTLKLSNNGAISMPLASDTVDYLYIDGSPMAAGTWGKTGSGADYFNDTYFTGTGVLTVLPEPATMALLGLGGLGVLLRRKRSK
jgi:hypothetical protein